MVYVIPVCPVHEYEVCWWYSNLGDILCLCEPHSCRSVGDGRTVGIPPYPQVTLVCRNLNK